MNTIKSSILGGALLFGASAAIASPITVGNVTWDPTVGSDFTATASVFESFVANVGETITGYGKITEVNGFTQAQFCASCDLTYTFNYQLVSSTNLVATYDGTNTTIQTLTQTWNGMSVDTAFTNTSIVPGDLTGVINTNNYDFEFGNGFLDVYSDTSANFDTNAPLLAEVTDGDLWLSLESNGLLTGTATDLFDLNLVNGNGFGFMDVTGGAAQFNFDTNGEQNGSDMRFESSFNKNTNAAEPGFPLKGSASMQGTSVPEPTSLALLGLGLLGFGATRKRK